MSSRNTIGGKNFKKAKRHNRNKVGEFDEEAQYYAEVRQRLGDNKLEIKLDDNRIVTVRIPGRYFKKVWVNKGDLICADECEMLWKVETEAEKERARARMNKAIADDEDGAGIVFGNEDIVDSDVEDDTDYKALCVRKKKPSEEEKSEDAELNIDDI